MDNPFSKKMSSNAELADSPEVLESADTLIPLNVLRPSYLADIKRFFDVKHLTAGEVLFEQGERDGHAIYLQVGKIRLVMFHKMFI